MKIQISEGDLELTPETMAEEYQALDLCQQLSAMGFSYSRHWTEDRDCKPSVVCVCITLTK